MLPMPTPVWLPIIVDSEAPITINAQIAEQIKLLIVMEELKPGEALPTVTQLAKHLGVNHNTIAAVYNYLIESSYLVAQRGKGTFVANTQAVHKIITYKPFYNLISQAFNAATRVGLSSSEFAGAAYAQAVILSQHTTTALKLVFVDCLHHKTNAYEAISSEIKQHLLFLSLEALKAQQSQALKDLLAAELVITTVQHQWEVSQFTTPEQEVIAVILKPHLQLLTKISSLPRNAVILLICQEEAESQEMKQILQQVGISHINFQTLSLESLEQNHQLLKDVDAVCVSKKVEDYIRQYNFPHNKIMVFNFSLDETNMSVLKARLAAIQVTKSTANQCS